MDLTDEEKEVLKRILGRLLGQHSTAPPVLTIRERRELQRKAAADDEKKKTRPA